MVSKGYSFCHDCSSNENCQALGVCRNGEGKLFHAVSNATHEAVQKAAAIIAEERKRIGPPENPPTKLWSALCNIWDNLDTLQQAIAEGEYK